MSKLAYVATPYSNITDKPALMREVAAFTGRYMVDNPGWFAVSGLIHHYATLEVPELGTDYAFWQQWCELLLSKSDKLIVYMIDGWQTSTGVKSEIAYATEHNIHIEYHHEIL